jgi:hypothetical protein
MIPDFQAYNTAICQKFERMSKVASTGIDGVGDLAVDWIVYLVGQPDLSAQPVVGSLSIEERAVY